MKEEQYKILEGGNMNASLLKDNLIYKEANKASEAIHHLLMLVRSRGID